MERRRKIWGAVFLALTALILIFIWGHSLAPGAGSAAESGRVLAALNGLLGRLGLPGLSTDHVVRKAAHFTEFAGLGAALSACVHLNRRQGREWLPLSLFLGLAACLADETIQLHTPGRDGNVRDVLLDFGGYAVGAALCGLVQWAARSSKKGGKGGNVSKK